MLHARAAVGFLVALPVTLPSRIKYMLWGEAGLSALIVSMCALDHALCSATPPLPPSASALSKRDVRVLKDFWQLLRMPQFMIITLAYSLSLGTFSAWSGVLDPILSPLNFSQTTVNWLGFISTVGSIIGGVAFGNLGDRLSVLKPVIVYTLGISCVFIGWFALIANHTLPRSIWQLFFSCTVGRCVVF